MRRSRHSPAELVPLVAAVVYLAVLGWDMTRLEIRASRLFGQDHRQGDYNPMEPGHPLAGQHALLLGAP
jgi:hypothetical protein